MILNNWLDHQNNLMNDIVELKTRLTLNTQRVQPTHLTLCQIQISMSFTDCGQKILDFKSES